MGGSNFPHSYVKGYFSGIMEMKRTGNRETEGWPEQVKYPIGSRLKELEKKGLIPFHMPGHKRKGAGLFPDAEICDVTEITGYDNLHDPQGMIRESEEGLKAIYGTVESRYLINGSTVGILASMASVCKPGDRILIGRNCHRSVYNGIRLLRLKPVYVYPRMRRQEEKDGDVRQARRPGLSPGMRGQGEDEGRHEYPYFGIAGSICPEDIYQMMVRYPDIKAVLVTSPTYEGVVSDIRQIRTMMDRAAKIRVPLIVDEAHGAHFHFHRYFPESAIKYGADLVVQSSHKTLPAMTQTALLHLCSDAVSPARIDDRLAVFESSSPSYVLLASAEYSVGYMVENAERVEQYAENLSRFREKCDRLHNIKLISREDGPFFDYDPGKLVFFIKGRGKELFSRLREEYGIEPEMAAESYVICMTSVMDDVSDFEALFQAVAKTDAVFNQSPSYESGGPIPKAVSRAFYSWECEDLPVVRCRPEEAVGKAAAQDIMIYPPGIPLIVAGERYQKEMVENIIHSLYNGYNVVGIERDGDCVFVLTIDEAKEKTFDGEERSDGE